MIEERSAPRFEKRAFTIFIEMESSSYDGSDGSDVVICKSINLSFDGLQVVIDNFIPVGKVFRLCLDVRGKEPIFVVGEVVWRRQESETGDYLVGFRLFKSDDTDYETWRNTVAALLAPLESSL